MSGTNSDSTVASGGIVNGLTPLSPGGELEVNGSAALVDATGHTVALAGKAYGIGDVMAALVTKSVVTGNASDSTDIASQKITVNGESTTAGAAIEAAAKTGSGTGGSSSELQSGMIVQPTATVSTANGAQVAASVAIQPFGPMVDAPGNLITVNPRIQYQKWRGGGACLVQSSGYVLVDADGAAQQDTILEKMFVTDGLSVVRVPITDTDFTDTTDGNFFELTPGATGAADLMNYYDFSPIERRAIPLLQKMKRLNPDLWILLTPWSAPSCLKASGSLLSGYFNNTAANLTAYATLLTQVVADFDARGLRPNAISIQNEFQENTNGGYPRCGWDTTSMGAFVPVLGAALRAAGYPDVCILYADTSYGSVHLSAPKVLATTGVMNENIGVGFHDYDSDNYMDVQNDLQPYPTLRKFFTELSLFNKTATSTVLSQWAIDAAITPIRHGCEALMWWCLVLDAEGGPYLGTPYPAPGSNGITLGLCNVQRDGTPLYTLPYAILTEITRRVKSGAVRIDSNNPTNAQNVFFKNPDGSLAGFIVNTGSAAVEVVIQDASTGNAVPLTIPAQSCAGVGWSAAGVVDTAGTFTAPGAPAITSTGNNAAGNPTFSLTAPTTVGNTPLGGFDIFRSATAGTVGTRVMRLLPSATSYADKYLSAGTTAYYTAYALNAAGYGPASSQVSGAAVSPSASSYSLSVDSASVVEGAAQNFTVTPSGTIGTTAVTVTPTSTVEGTFTPSSVTLAAGSSTAVSFVFTSSATGSGTVSTTNSGGLTDPAGVTITIAAAPVATTTYSLNGPSAVTDGTAAEYTVTQGGGTLASAVVVTPSSTVAGTFSPTSVTLPAGSGGTATFTFTPTGTGSGTLSVTNNGSLTNPTSISITASAEAVPFSSYLMTGPATATAGSPITLTFTPGSGSANASDIVVTPASSLSGTFSPATVTFAAGSTAAQTCTFTPSAAGAATISVTNSASLSNPSSLSVTVSSGGSLPAHGMKMGGAGGSLWASVPKKALNSSGIAILSADFSTNTLIWEDSTVSTNVLMVGSNRSYTAENGSATYGASLLWGQKGGIGIGYGTGSSFTQNFSAAGALTDDMLSNGRARIVGVLNPTSSATTNAYGTFAAQTTTFLYSLDGVTWTQITQISNGGTAFADNNGNGTGIVGGAPSAVPTATFYNAQYLDGAGNKIFSLDFTTLATGATSVVDAGSSGLTWAVSSPNAIT